jgi:hypothetical protein
MHKDKYVFAQLISFLDRNKFNYIARKYGGDKYVKHFTCWNQLLVLMFGQLCNRSSLRDLILAIEAHNRKTYHLGFGNSVTRSNLAKANQNRDYRIFEEFAYHLVEVAKTKRIQDLFKLKGKVYAFDSTTIDLCLSVFWWAKFRKNKGGIKVHTLYDIETRIPTFFHITDASVNDVNAMDVIPYEPNAYYVFDRGYNDFKRLYNIHSIESFFVVRAKSNLKFKAIKWKRRMQKNIRSDSISYLTGYQSRKRYPDKIRRIVFWDQDQQREFVFLTNATKLTALQIAELYKNRWQIELFFKWLKQHLKIERFWGTSENAVRIQIYSAIITYCLVAIVQSDLWIERSTYEVLQILSISLTDTSNLRDLFDKSNFKNFKELKDSSEPNLFNF